MLEQKDTVAEMAARRQRHEDDARVLLDTRRRRGQTLSAFARVYDFHPKRLGRWHRLRRAEPQEAVRFHPGRVRGVERRSGRKR